MKMLLSMPSIIFNNVDIKFAKKKLIYRTYTNENTLTTTCSIKFINKKKFAKMALDENIKTFVIHISSLDLRLKITIHLAKNAQITLLLAKKVTVLAKYLNFADVFLKKSIEILSKFTKANKHAIELEKSKQPPYGPIYSLELVEFKTLKTYIKTDLTNDFIKVSKLPANTQIFFVFKFNNSFCLCVNHQ